MFPAADDSIIELPTEKRIWKKSQQTLETTILNEDTV